MPSHAGTEEGFGLGLYIVGRLCNILGHPLQLNSKPGRGTVFRLLVYPTELRAAAERAAASTIDIKATPDPMEGQQPRPAPAQ